MGQRLLASPNAFLKIQAVAWAGFSAVIFLLYWPSEGTLPAFSSLALKIGLGVLSSFLLRPLCRFVWRRRGSFVPLVVAVVACAAMLALLDEWIAEWLTHLAWDMPPTLVFRSALTASLRYQFVLGAWCISYFGVKFLHQAERQRDLMRQARRRRTESMIASFRYQLPGRFLSDMLRGIAHTIESQDSSHASLMIARFGDLLARILERPEKHFATLSQEIAHAREYLDLQGMLLGHALLFEFELIGDVTDCSVPRWLLVPLLDEAFRSEQTPSLQRLVITRIGTGLRLDLVEPGITKSRDAAATHASFASIESLLALIYGDRALFTRNVDAVTRLRIELPLESFECTAEE